MPLKKSPVADDHPEISPYVRARIEEVIEGLSPEDKEEARQAFLGIEHSMMSTTNWLAR